MANTPPDHPTKQAATPPAPGAGGEFRKNKKVKPSDGGKKRRNR